MIYLRWGFESLLTDLRTTWGVFFFLPLLLLGLNFVLHFNFSVCSPCTCSEALPCSDMPLCLLISFFCSTFIKNNLFFIQVQNEIPFLFSWLNFSVNSWCSVFISCRLGEYHLCFKSWASAFRTSVFFQSPSAFSRHSCSN